MDTQCKNKVLIETHYTNNRTHLFTTIKQMVSWRGTKRVHRNTCTAWREEMPLLPVLDKKRCHQRHCMHPHGRNDDYYSIHLTWQWMRPFRLSPHLSRYTPYRCTIFIQNQWQVQECVEGKYCCMPKDEVNWNSHPMEHGLKGWDVACHGKRKMPLTTCPFWTLRNLYSKEGSTPPDIKVNTFYTISWD